MNTTPRIDCDDIALRARRVVEVLARQFPSRSGLNPRALSAASEFIEQEFQKLGFTTDSQLYEAHGTIVRNLIALQPGREETKPCIVIGAHYDTVDGTPGADDNASGVAGVLEAARLLKKYPNRRTIRYVAFTHEEPPYFYTGHMGSRKYAKRLRSEGINVQVMVCLEMIGYADENIRQVYPFPLMRQIGRYPQAGNFIGIVGNLRTMKTVKVVRKAMCELCTLGVESLTAPGFLPPLFLSDHSSFWKYGFPAVMITDTAFLRNPHYHLPGDTADTLNYAFLAEVVKGVFHAVKALDELRG